MTVVGLTVDAASLMRGGLFCEDAQKESQNTWASMCSELKGSEYPGSNEAITDDDIACRMRAFPSFLV